MIPKPGKTNDRNKLPPDLFPEKKPVCWWHHVQKYMYQQTYCSPELTKANTYHHNMTQKVKNLSQYQQNWSHSIQKQDHNQLAKYRNQRRPSPMESRSLKYVEYVEYLGVIFDSKSTFNHHITEITPEHAAKELHYIPS